jgi:hypothetical protein
VRPSRKVCTKCGQKKPLNMFYPNSNGSGYRARCKSCYKIMQKEGSELIALAKILLPELEDLQALYDSEEVRYFGYTVGVIVKFTNFQNLAFSSLKKFELFDTVHEAKAWMVRQFMDAAKKIEHYLLTQ